jgi:CheY-like chemotaxis protein
VLRTSAFEAERFAHGLEVIERNVAAQAKLIEDLLDVSRIIAGKLRVSLRPMLLLPSIETAVEAMRPAAEVKGVALRLVIGPEVDPRAVIAGDADRLQQVGWNLVSNAIKFTPPGGRIEVAVTRAAGGFQLRVTDNGKGISPHFLRHVFDRFRQDDSSSTRAHGGLGIGLAIVQHIIELHGGKVEAESPGANRGATFTVTLPELAEGLAALAAAASSPLPAAPESPAVAAPARPPLVGIDEAGIPGAAGAGEEWGRGPAWAPAPATALPAAGAAGAAGEEFRRLKLVVVDDEPDTREILGEILRTAGATVATASCLTEALALCDRFRPDLLISDIAMPGGDGYALIRQLRRRGPQRGGRVPAIAVSAHAREEDRRRALAAGFERYVTKPVEPAELLAVVREVAARLPVVAGLGSGAADLEPAAHADGPAGAEAPALPEAGAPVVAAVQGSGGNGRPGAAIADRERERGSGQAGDDRAGGAAAWAEAGAPAVVEAVPPGADTGARRILLVEDDADTREALKTLLELSGHQVEVASDGGEAVAHAVANRPDVALVDIGLPEIDGNEVARRIRAQLGAGGIFLVALTGYGGEAEEALARAAGFDAHFTKPVELSRLDRLLRARVRAAL